MGSIKNIKVINSGFLPSNKNDSEASYLGFEIDVKCEKSKNDIENCLNPLRDNYKIKLPSNARIF